LFLTTPAQTKSALSYAADPQHKVMGGSDAGLRAELEKAFADDAALKEFDRVMSANGYSSRNVADDMAVLLQVKWATLSGSTARISSRST